MTRSQSRRLSLMNPDVTKVAKEEENCVIEIEEVQTEDHATTQIVNA